VTGSDAAWHSTGTAMERGIVGDTGENQDSAQLLARLKNEHAQLEQRLAELDSHISLTAEEQVERVRIKKLKLAKKDQMARLAVRLGQK
jgi:hypothetical protein